MSVHERAGRTRSPRTWSTSPAWSPRTTPSTPTPTSPTSGSRSARPGTAARRCTSASTTTTSPPPRRRSATHRRAAGIDGPLFLAKDTHALSEPAWATALEVLAANDVRVLVDSRDALHADAGAVARGAASTTAAAPPGSPTASSSRRRTTRRPTAASSTTRRTAARPAATSPGRCRTPPTSTCATGSRGVRRMPLARARGRRHHRHVRLPRRVRRRPAVGARPRRGARGRRAHRRRPARRRERRLLGRDRRAARARPDGREPAGRPDLALHDARLGRQDPDGLLARRTRWPR